MQQTAYMDELVSALQARELKLETHAPHRTSSDRTETRASELNAVENMLVLQEDLLWAGAYQCSRGPTKSEHPWNRAGIGNLTKKRSQGRLWNQTAEEQYETRPQAKRKSIETSDGIDHIPLIFYDKNANRWRYVKCSQKTFIYCRKCEVSLCIKQGTQCFYEFKNKITLLGSPSKNNKDVTAPRITAKDVSGDQQMKELS